MECLIGVQFKDFVLVAADMTNATSIMVMKNGMMISFIKSINLFDLHHLH
jgi:20S proteasome alpha/beta subunit